MSGRQRQLQVSRPIQSEGWCAMQGSNLRRGVLHQGLTGNAPQIAPQNSGRPEEVEEIAAAWCRLPAVLKDAILGIVRSAQPVRRS